jgi:hypothetical protein
VRQQGEVRTEIIRPQHDCENAFPKAQVQEPEREESCRYPHQAQEGLMLNFDSRCIHFVRIHSVSAAVLELHKHTPGELPAVISIPQKGRRHSLQSAPE